MIVVPPGGFAGTAQLPMAVTQTWRKALGARGAPRTRRRKARAAAKPRRKRAKAARARSRGASRLVKGSAAAKRFMAKIRRLRKK